MTFPSLNAWPIFAETRTFFDVTRLHAMTQWWHWMALISVCLLIAVFLISVYRRDSAELPKGTGVLLMILRLTAFAGLLVFFLNIEKRTERKLVKPSRVSILVDTSQSMGLSDATTQGSTSPKSRLASIATEFSDGSLLDDLRQKHEVTVYRFDQTAIPESLGTFPKEAIVDDSATNQGSQPSWEEKHREAAGLYQIAAGILGLALVACVLHWILGSRVRGKEGESWALLFAGVLLIVGVVVVAVTNLRHPDVPLTTAFDDSATPPAPTTNDDLEETPETPEEIVVEWPQQLRPRGTETQLGEAVRWVVEKERGGPTAGIVVMSDGRSNAGLDAKLAAEIAEQANIPVFPIGSGSEKMPKSVRVVDLEAPARVFPGDKFTMTGYLQADGLEGRTVKAELVSTDAELQNDTEVLAAEERVNLGPDGEIQTITFELDPEDLGRRRWTLRVSAPQEDLNESDNERSATVEVVERKNRVLILAGGPTREYRFVRNLLFRDENTTLDVLLQSAPAGAAQEANNVLLEFPDTPEAMFEYDCLLAFDPDWRKLSSEQIELLNRWVSEKAGGLIVVAGPVFTPQWTRSRQGSDSEKLQTIKALYPVTFFGRSSASAFLGRTTSDTAWPLQFDDEGQRAPFLQLEDTPEASAERWNEFEGIYGFQAIKDVKPGAKVFAYFSDPKTALDAELPVFMAGQFYGAGRVFFLASGEMWRLRGTEERLFDTFYTKLIRYVSQGRLLRDSSRGILLIDKERASLGDTITVRATLSDEQFRPLQIPAVTASVVHESGSREPLELRQITNAERPGMYTGQFTTAREGDFRIELPIPGSDDELLVQEVRVRLPAREIERPQRNDALLSEIAQASNGVYFVSLDAALGRESVAPLTNQIPSKDQETFLPGTPDKDFEERLMTWLLIVICGALSLEWLIRRLNKLA